MKTYVMSFADSVKHIPEHKDRTAYQRYGDWDVRFQTWPNRAAMAKSIRMQQSRSHKYNDWIACIKLEDGEGY